MNWETFYLVAFLVGFLSSALSFFAGSVHLPHFPSAFACQGRRRTGRSFAA